MRVPLAGLLEVYDTVPIIRVQATRAAVTGIPADAVTNVFHFDSLTTPVGSTEYQDCADAVEDFFDGANLVTPVAGYIHSLMADALTLKVYDLSDPEPRVPRITETVTSSGAGSSERLPNELAVCLSFQGAAISGLAQARRRGRLFIGPLSGGAWNPATARPSDVFMTDLATAAIRLVEDTATRWAVYSTVLNAAAAVTDGWVDNAFDVQRRRGLAPTIKAAWAPS